MFWRILYIIAGIGTCIDLFNFWFRDLRPDNFIISVWGVMFLLNIIFWYIDQK